MIILDASAAIKLVITERDSEKITAAFNEITIKGEPILVPDLMLSESINGLWKHLLLIKDINMAQFDIAVKHMLEIWHSTEAISTEELTEKAISIATKYKLSFYDSLYVALSLSNNARLLSCDQGILDKSDEMGLNVVRLS